MRLVLVLLALVLLVLELALVFLAVHNSHIQHLLPSTLIFSLVVLFQLVKYHVVYLVLVLAHMIEQVGEERLLIVKL
jgi:hypothetical protein